MTVSPYRSSHLRLILCFILFPLMQLKAQVAKPGLQSGYWRASILRADGNPIVFLFQVSAVSGKKIIRVINGSEKLVVDQVRQKADSVYIDMPFFDSHFALRMTDKHTLKGDWIKYSGEKKTVVPFEAVYQDNRPARFPARNPPRYDISGRWSALFTGKDDTTAAVGEFRQKGSDVKGTFLTPTGDYRYLDGVVDGDTLILSAFDGGHAYSFVSLISDSRNMSGHFYSGAASVEQWTGAKNDSASLPDEYGLSHLRDSLNAVPRFRFPDLQGHMISLSDPRYKNKVVILQMLGSWCPNCMDETGFLSPWYDKNRSRGVEVIGLAYERTANTRKITELLQPFVKRFSVKYPILITGALTSDSLRSQKTIPEIDQIAGFPTTIFLDKKGEIRKIHTGFNGPGTSAHYTEYIREFNTLVDRLLAE